tara:strand:- start:747 stop:1055 length:309 start_codon:yes stop_codon:yes gene_type:complete
MEIEILDGWVDLDEKACREVSGTVSINGDIYNWELETDDGFTSIYINKEENEIWDDRSFVEASLECDEDLDMYNISEEDGLAVFEEILDVVEEDYSIEGWDE